MTISVIQSFVATTCRSVVPVLFRVAPIIRLNRVSSHSETFGKGLRESIAL